MARAGARASRASPAATVIGTGGYASGAALAFAARARHSDSASGAELRSRNHDALLRAPRARRVPRLSRRREAKLHAGGPHTQLFDSGNPIEPPPVPRPSRPEARAEWGFPAEGGRVLLAFGGSQGARPLNDAIASLLDAGLPPGLFLIWATGTGMVRRLREVRIAERARAAVSRADSERVCRRRSRPHARRRADGRRAVRVGNSVAARAAPDGRGGSSARECARARGGWRGADASSRTSLSPRGSSGALARAARRAPNTLARMAEAADVAGTAGCSGAHCHIGYLR